ncbi:leucine-rich repeat protein [Tanacetum coccineum]
MSQNNYSRNMLSNVLSTLISLDLSYNKFSGRLPHLSNDSSLYSLDLSNNAFEGSLHHLPCPYISSGVVVLDLGNNHLSVIEHAWKQAFREITCFFSELNKLADPQLNENELVGSIPTWLGREVLLLRLVNLKSNNFDGNIPHEICYLTHIQILVLADNNLSGNIPRCFNKLCVLFGNKLASMISYLLSIGDVSSDPGEDWDYLGNMKALVSCDLSLNKLYGELPMSLSSLSLLSSFNVSYNNLTGRVPSSTQLQSFNETSFFGNKLCGDPLVEQCARVEAPAPPDTTNL